MHGKTCWQRRKKQFVDERKKTVKGKWYYDTELEKELGSKSKFKKHIREGKYEEGKDQWGEVMYRKYEYTDEASRAVTKTGELKVTKTVDKQEALEADGMFDKFFIENESFNSLPSLPGGRLSFSRHQHDAGREVRER